MKEAAGPYLVCLENDEPMMREPIATAKSFNPAQQIKTARPQNCQKTKSRRLLRHSAHYQPSRACILLLEVCRTSDPELLKKACTILVGLQLFLCCLELLSRSPLVLAAQLQERLHDVATEL